MGLVECNKGEHFGIECRRLNQHPQFSTAPKTGQERGSAASLSRGFRRLLFKCIASILSSGHFVSGLALVRGAAPPFNPPDRRCRMGLAPNPSGGSAPCTPEKRFCDADRDTNHTGGKAALAGDC
jgi:hypothetical protein